MLSAMSNLCLGAPGDAAHTETQRYGLQPGQLHIRYYYLTPGVTWTGCGSQGINVMAIRRFKLSHGIGFSFAAEFVQQ